MRVYKLLSKQFALKSLRERRLKISRISELNDPFEMFPFDVSDRVARMTLQVGADYLNERYGLLCFSRAWSNPVLWTHYADRHRGVCLGFDISDTHVREITYTPARIPFPQDLDASGEEQGLRWADRLLFTKFEDWRYEDEIRVYATLETEEGGLFFKELDKDLELAEVIVGMQSQTCLREIERALEGYAQSVKMFKTAAAGDSFGVVEADDPLRNHDDCRYWIQRDGIYHPVEFYR